MRFPLFKPKSFEPDFPIIPLYATEDEARKLLSQYSAVSEEEPESDRTIAQKLLVAANDETRISVGIWDGRVRFTNYQTERFNQNDELKGKKLGWFVDYYGGSGEFEEPMDTSYMIFLRNSTKKIMIVFGLHMGPVRVIDQNPEHWPDTSDQRSLTRALHLTGTGHASESGSTLATRQPAAEHLGSRTILVGLRGTVNQSK